MILQRIAYLFLTAAIMLAGPADAGDAERAADILADAVEQVSGGKALCAAKHAAKAIICIANADNENAESIAAGIVLIAKTHDLPLAGWSLTVATPTDYVVTRRF